MTDEPGVIDGEIIEEMKSLELMIAFHKKAIEKGLEPSLYCPAEIERTLDVKLARISWDNGNYDTVRAAYAEAWTAYYTIVFNEETYYTTQELAEIFKVS